MEKQCETERIPEILRRFAAACPQIAADPDSDLSKRVLQRYPQVLLVIAKQTAKDFAEGHSEQDLRRLLRRKHFPSRMLVEEGLETVWSTWYVPQAIQSDLKLLLSLEPKDEYPEARAMERHFVLHLGGTNTGKTYEGFRCLRQARTGVYLAPLRLLAVEAQEALLDAGINCSLTTGEEEDVREDDTHVAATAEKLDLKARYDVAVIDECQMIEDPQRGYAWTRAILGVQAPEVHLCAAPQAKEILVRLIRSCGDSFEIKIHKRRTPLVCMNRTVDLEHLQPGDALIAFSKVDVLSVAEELRRSGKEPAIIYGALPYAARRMQMEDFLAGETQYVVATDAIGMGLNLPIRRILFLDTEKFDGVERRELKPQEIQQIAGRAGRYGMYSKGFVGAVRNLSTIQEGLRAAVPQIREAVLGFSDLVLQSRFDLLEVLTEWNRMPAEEPYRKLDISRYIWVISTMRQRGFALSKEEELRAANIPFDETDSVLEELFFSYLRCYAQGDPIQQPEDVPLSRGYGEAAGGQRQGRGRHQRDPDLPPAEQHPLLRDLRQAAAAVCRQQSLRCLPAEDAEVNNGDGSPIDIPRYPMYSLVRIYIGHRGISIYEIRQKSALRQHAAAGAQHHRGKRCVRLRDHPKVGGEIRERL